MIELSSEQRRVAFDDGGNVIVEAAPGAGKTRVLVARVEHLLRERGVAPERLLVLTFSRRAVRELRDRVAGAVPDLAARVEVRTFHGFANRLLAVESPAFTSGRLLGDPASDVLLEEAFARVEPERFARNVFRSPAFARDAERYVADLGRLDAARRRSLAASGSAALRDLVHVAEELRALRRAAGVTDYDDLVVRAAQRAADPASRAAVWLRGAGRREHVLVDEFQDTDPQQLALLGALGGTIFAVGDAAQAIYGFRGASRDAIDRAVEELRMRRLPLRATRRCPPEICALVNATPGLPERSAVVCESAYRGSATVEAAATPLDEAGLIAEHVARALGAGTPPGEVAVLLRSLDPLGAFVRGELERRGIRCSLGGAAADEPVVRTLLAALRALDGERDAARWLDLFCSDVLAYPRLRLARRFAERPPECLDDVLALLRAFETPRLPAARAEAALRAARDAWASGDLDAAARTLARGLDLLGAALALRDEASASRAARRLGTTLDALDDLVDLYRKLGRRLDAGELLARFERSGGRLFGEEDGAATVRVMTIHAAKGLEFDAVVVGDAADGRLPVELRRDGVLPDGDLAIARAHGCDLGATPSERMAEERALWYVALTRARRTLAITYARETIDGSPQNPSRFLPPPQRDALDGVDPFRADLSYTGAASLPGATAPEPVELPPEIGVTRLDDWFACERKFYYSAVLGLPAEGALARTFGTAMHAVLERFHRACTRVDAAFDAVAARTELRRLRAVVWQEREAEFGSALERTAAAASADRMLDAYADALGEEGRLRPFTVESVEREVRVPLGSLTLTGKIDRVDRFDDGSTRIVDFKTGRMRARLADAVVKLDEAVREGKLYRENSPRVASVQLPLYRRALAGASSVALVYLRGAGDDGSRIAVDETPDGEIFARADDAIERGFTERVRPAPERFRTTEDGRTCERCSYAAICDGVLSAVPGDD